MSRASGMGAYECNWEKRWASMHGLKEKCDGVASQQVKSALAEWILLAG